MNTELDGSPTGNHTPLHLACGVPIDQATNQYTRVAQMLLENGADPNAEDEGGYTALHLAVANNNIECVRVLIEYRCKVNHQNQDRFTPLHTACRYQFQSIATLLMESGADPHIPDGQGRTAMQLSQRYGVVLVEPTIGGSFIKKEEPKIPPQPPTPIAHTILSNPIDDLSMNVSMGESRMAVDDGISQQLSQEIAAELKED